MGALIKTMRRTNPGILLTLAILAILQPLASGQALLKLDTRGDRNTYKGCSQKDVDTCTKAELDIDLLKKGNTIELPDGTKMTLSRRGSSTSVFKCDDSEAVFTWSGDHVAGHVNNKGNSWVLEGCGEGCFLWIKQTTDWLDEATSPQRNTTSHRNLQDLDNLLQKGYEDTITEVTYSIMIWYTPQFYDSFASEADMNVFIDLIFEETNQGYINSKIPIRVSKLGVKPHPTLVDISNPDQLVDDFEASMPSSELLNCADAAALLIHDFDSCGIANNIGTFSSCRSFSVTKKSCATGYYSFGHELAHNFGALHNIERGGYYGGDAYGYLIQPRGDFCYSGYRTILGYSYCGHENRVNYYSNPDVIFPKTGTPTGIKDKSNNARVITANRFVIAACGTDEPNGSCNGEVPTPGCGTKNVDCQVGNGAEYRGAATKTVTGFECTSWRNFYGLGYHNNCCNPDGEPGVWCFTSNPNKYWELCDVKECSDCD